MKLKRVISILIILSFLVIPVSAVGDENIYTGVWFADGKSYQEKYDWFKELIGYDIYNMFANFESSFLTNGQTYYDNLRQSVLNHSVSYDDLPVHEQLALYNYETYGSYTLTPSQMNLKEQIETLFGMYYVTADEVAQDIANYAIPTINPIPTPVTYSFEMPDAYLPQER